LLACLPPLWPETRGSAAPDPSRAPLAALLSSPPTQTRARRAVSGSLGRSFQVMFFHKSEIISLDSENPRKAGKTAENQGFFVSIGLNGRANRGKCSLF
jgi:hypothetical protein